LKRTINELLPLHNVKYEKNTDLSGRPMRKKFGFRLYNAKNNVRSHVLNGCFWLDENYSCIIIITILYIYTILHAIVSLPFDWTRTLSPIFFYSFITRWTFQSASRNYEDPPSWKREILHVIFTTIYKIIKMPTL
jgi:hypothetical protein